MGVHLFKYIYILPESGRFGIPLGFFLRRETVALASLFLLIFSKRPPPASSSISSMSMEPLQSSKFKGVDEPFSLSSATSGCRFIVQLLVVLSAMMWTLCKSPANHARHCTNGKDYRRSIRAWEQQRIRRKSPSWKEKALSRDSCR